MKFTVVVAGLALILAGAPIATRAQAAQPKPVTLELKDYPVRDALVELLKKADVQYLLNAEISGTISVKFKELPFETALKLILDSSSVPLNFTVEGGVYVVRTQSSRLPAGLTVSGRLLRTTALTPVTVEADTVTMDFKEAPLRQALEHLFSSVKAQFSIDNSVQGNVTIRAAKVPFEIALKLILRASPTPLTFIHDKERNVYIVKPRALDETPKDTNVPPPPANP